MSHYKDKTIIEKVIHVADLVVPIGMVLFYILHCYLLGKDEFKEKWYKLHENKYVLIGFSLCLAYNGW